MGVIKDENRVAMAADVVASWRALAGLSVSWERVMGTDLGSEGITVATLVKRERQREGLGREPFSLWIALVPHRGDHEGG